MDRRLDGIFKTTNTGARHYGSDANEICNVPTGLLAELTSMNTVDPPEEQIGEQNGEGLTFQLLLNCFFQVRAVV